MDLMFTRYSDPFSFMDSLIENGSFGGGIDRIYEIRNDDVLWELYLHKVFDRSFEDFKDEITGQSKNIHRAVMTKAEFNTTIEMSKSILESIDPTGKGGELC